MPYDPYLINRIKGAVRARDVGKVEELWIDLQGSQPLAELDLFYEIAGEVAERGDKDRAADLLLLLKEDLKTAERHDELFEILRKAVRYSARVKNVREDLVEQYRRVYGERPGFEGILSRTDLAGEGKIRDAVESLDQSFAFTAGDYVFHSGGWGVGKVVEAQPETGEFLIDFSRNRGQRMEAGLALKKLERRADDDLDVLLWTDKDRVRELAESDPLDLLQKALVANNGKLASRDLRDKLTDVLDKSRWTKFWAKARKLAKEDPTIEVGPAPRSIISLRAEPLSREEELVQKIRRSRSFTDRLEMARAELTSIKKDAGDEPPSWMAQVLEMLDQYQGKGDALRAAKAELALFKTELCEVWEGALPDIKKGEVEVDPDTGEPIGESVPAHLAEPLGELDKKSLPKVLKNMTIAEYRKRSISLVPALHGEQAAEILRAVVLDPAPQTWMHAVETLKKAGRDDTIHEVIKTLVVKPKRYAAAFAAYARARLNRNLEILGRREAEIASKAIQVLDHIQLKHKAEDTKRSDKAALKATVDALRAMFNEKSQKVLSQVISEGTEDEVRRILMLVRQSPALTDTIRRATEAFVVEHHPALLAALNQDTQRGVDDDELPALYTTPEGKRRQEKKLRQIMDEEMPKITVEIGKALDFGDISENAELDAAREKQQQLAQQAQRMQEDLERVVVIDPETVQTETVSVGTRVTVENTQSSEETAFTILGPWDIDDSDPSVISHLSPMSQGLLGKKPGETAQVTLPGGATAEYKVKAIEKATIAAG